MLKIRRNFGLLIFFFKRYIANSSLSGNKHYQFFIRHVKTHLNNQSYIIKQTTAIPKQINYQSPFSYRDIGCTLGTAISYNPPHPTTKHSNFEINNKITNNFLEKNVHTQEVTNKLATQYSKKEHKLTGSNYNYDKVEKVKKSRATNETPSFHAKTNEYRDGIFFNNYTENTSSNHQENNLFPTQQKKISLQDVKIADNGNSLSLTEIKSLVNNKIKDIIMKSFTKNDAFSDDFVILNQKIPETESLIFFKNKDLNVIEFSHTNFDNDVRNYIKKLDIIESNMSAPERLNFIRFFKVYSSDNLFDGPISYKSRYSKDHLLNQHDSQDKSKSDSSDINTAGSWNGLYETTLKVKNSVPLERNAETFWIPYEEGKDNLHNMTSYSFYEVSPPPQSGPPFTEQVPINRDKLIEEKVVPNTSILNIINSIDKSAVIIQKDLYITDRIIQKIQKDEKRKVIDKNKLETTAEKDHVMYLETPSVKRNMFVLSLAGLTAGISEVSSNVVKEELNNSNKKNADMSQTTSSHDNKHNGLPAFVIQNSVDNDGKISLSMLYEPNKVVPMSSFLSKEAPQEYPKLNVKTGALDRIDINNELSGQSHTNQSHCPASKDILKNINDMEKFILSSKNCAEDSQLQSIKSSNNNYQNPVYIAKVSSSDERMSLNYQGTPDHNTNTKFQDQLSTTTKNQLKQLEEEYQHQKTTSDEYEKKSPETLKEVERFEECDNRSQGESLKDYIPHKNVLVYDSRITSLGEGMPMDVYMNRCNTTTSPENINYLNSNIKNSPMEDTKNKFPPASKKSLEIFTDVSPKNETVRFDMNSTSKEKSIDVTNFINSTPNSLHGSYKQQPINNVQTKNLENIFSIMKKLTNESKKINSTQTLSDVDKSLETLIKYYILKKEIAASNDLKNASEKQFSGSPKEDVSHIAQNIIPDIVKAVDKLLQKYNLKREISFHGDLSNGSEKKCSETFGEKPNKIAHRVVQVVTGSLESWLKNNLPREIISASKSLKNVSEKPYSDMSTEDPTHLAHNIVPDIVKSLDKLFKGYFSKTKESISITSSPDEEIPIECHFYNINTTKTLLEDNDYQPSNMTHSKLEVMEKDFLDQEEITEDHEISVNKPTHNVEPLAEEERFLSNKNYPAEDDEYFLNSNNTETNSKSNMSDDKRHEPNNKSQYTLTDQVSFPQFYSLGNSNEAGTKLVINEKDAMKHTRPINEEGSCNEKRIFLSDSGRKSEAQVLLKDYTHSDPPTIHNKESHQPPIMKYGDVLRGLNPISGNSGKGAFDGRKIDKKIVPIKKNFENSNKNNSSVDRIKKTTISSVEQNNFTDINVSEVETYVDSRLPIPFSTETFFQIFGSNHFLRDHSSLIDVAKYRLSTANTIMEQHSNLSAMAKLDDIRRSVQNLNVIAMNPKLSQIKKKIPKNKALGPLKEESESSANCKGMVKSGTKEQHGKIETSKNKKEEANNLENVSDSVSKFTFTIFNNKNLPIKDLKQINKQNLLNQKNTPEIKNQDHKLSSKDENSLLIVKTKSKNLKESKTSIKKPEIQKVELTGIKISRAKYVDLLNFNKNEKNKRHVIEGHKKGLYDHRGLSKRDKKILREISKEIPKQKIKGKSGRRRPIKPITSRNTGRDIEQPIKSLSKKSKDIESTVMLSKNDNKLVGKDVIPNTHLLNKQKLLPPQQNNQEKKEVQKTVTEKKENISNKVIQKVDKRSVEKEKSLKYERKKLKEINPEKTVEKVKIFEAKHPKAEKFNTSEKGNLKQVSKSKKSSINNIESKNKSIDRDNLDKFGKMPICQTYIATEAYINQPEKIHQIPEKIFTSKNVIKKNPTPQKVTILENIKTIEENNSDALKIQDDFKKELIRKSQNKIEHKTNIDFRVRTPKLKSPKSKVIALKSKQKGKLSQSTVSEKMLAQKKDKKRAEIKNKHITTKKHLKNEIDHASPMEIRTPKKANATRKSASQQNNIKNDELHKVNQLVQHNKQTVSQTKPKTTELINNKPPERMSKETEKLHYNEKLKIVATDQLQSPKEPKIGKNVSVTGISENIDKKNFLMFLIDVDKMSKEIKPELDLRNCQKCQVAHDKITDFPLHNQQKKLLFKPPFQILNLGPSNDPLLRNELKFYPSVTKVLNTTIPESSREILREWRKGMIAELGENGFKSFYKGQLINGNKFNCELHNFLISREKHKQDLNNLGLKSIDNVLRRTSDLSAINSHVIHRKLAYRGVIDCVAKYQNRPVLIEWKRVENPQVKIENSSIEIAATQLAAYVGALNYDETYKFQISGGLIVLAYNDGSEAEVIEINTEQCNEHWIKWLRRLQAYHELSRNKTA